MDNNSFTVIWAVLGIALIIAEVFSGAFVLVFFGGAALLVAGARLLGLANLALELVLFALLGMMGALFLRKRISAAVHSRSGYRSDDKIVLSEDVPAGGSATVSYQGTSWTAVNESTTDFKKGQTAHIARTEGIKLYLAR